jgi:hypothetical protein
LGLFANFVKGEGDAKAKVLLGTPFGEATFAITRMHGAATTLNEAIEEALKV